MSADQLCQLLERIEQHTCSRDANQGRGQSCPQHPYLFESRNGGQRVDTLLDECGPEGAYKPEPVIVESKALKVASNVVLCIFMALTLIVIGGPVFVHIAARMGWLQ